VWSTSGYGVGLAEQRAASGEIEMKLFPHHPHLGAYISRGPGFNNQIDR